MNPHLKAILITLGIVLGYMLLVWTFVKFTYAFLGVILLIILFAIYKVIHDEITNK